MNGRTLRRWVAAGMCVVLLPACGNSDDKVGGDTVVLRLATIDSVNNNGQSFGPEAFVEALDSVSGGRIQVEVEEVYGDGAADAESELVAAIANGDVDGGWPSTRAFAGAGIEGLGAVEAPLMLTSYDAQRAVATGSVADELLAQLDGTGVVGLGVAVGPLRRPFGVEGPLLAPDDWDGATFRSYNSPVQEDAIAALGGDPVHLGLGWAEAAHAGELDGVELDIAQYSASDFDAAPFVTSNIVLWPKMFVLSISQKRFDSLSDEEQGFVQEAAQRAVQASVDATYDETEPARGLCETGVSFIPATDDQVASVRRAVAPVIEGLADDPDDSPILAAIKAIAEEHPEPDVPEVPAACSVAGGNDEDDIPDEAAAIPDGIYRVTITPDDVAAAGIGNGPGWSGTWTLRISDATFQLTCTPHEAPGRDCGNVTTDAVLEAGYLRGIGSTVYFVGDGERMAEANGCSPAPTEPNACFVLDPYSADWDLDGDTLSFSTTEADNPTLVLKPWTKIG